MKRNVTIVTDAADLAAHAAEHLIAVALGAIAEHGRADIALAGGSTPRAMNELLAAPDHRDRLDWTRVRFFFSDERCVPPEDSQSNYRMSRETLFDPLRIAASQIHRMNGEIDPQRAAKSYEALLLSELGSPPAFDLVALGMGPDGHTASLFPGTIDRIDARAFVAANYVPKFGTYRITFTPRTIDAARHVMITAGGAEKAAALAGVLTGPRDPNRYPAQLVDLADGEVQWFVDAAAAAPIRDRLR